MPAHRANLRRICRNNAKEGKTTKKVMSFCAHTAYTSAMDNDMTYCELKRREVINGSDGSRMGHIIDMVFSVDSGKIKGIILPYGKRGFFTKSQDLFVPWQCVQKIGEDVILVEIRDLPGGTPICTPAQKHDKGRPPLPPPPPPPQGGRPPAGGNNNCDGKCEKCMLFDCASRWGLSAREA